ncbi:Rossmann-fold NAD(P)-binding domain-containing protein [Sphingobacterium chuzhouense]|uniref:Uncharacterized protein n=1 Tax=Sphingobacterium chuzhouense TaxID=1742264 RepID=A0ABR7XSE2_9SPHI|nr:hypothetical protein [Sphingobacterium chuzhouense]MBD1422090.1 hypothetical protein [Sphingobacterium chuzhouense]
MDILISGLNNYVGRRCTSLMADKDFRLFAITRNRKLFEERMADPIRAQIFEVDLLKGDTDDNIGLPYLDASFYFTQVPALDDMVNVRVELLCLRNFIRLIKRLNCDRLVYVARIMDKRCLQPILDLLEEFKMDYTVVLKNIVVGEDCLLYDIYEQVSGYKMVFYSKQHGGGLFQPIGIHDFIRWLKAILHVPAFHHNVLEIGGGDMISAVDFYRLYRKLKLKLKSQWIITLPNWLFRLIYRRKINDNTETAEFLRLIQVDGIVDNSWRANLPFTFTSLKEILLAK